MPIKTTTTRTICNPNDFIDNCSSIEELQKLISKCQDKITAIKNNKIIKLVEQMIDTAKEISEIYPWGMESSPFYDNQGIEYTWNEIQEVLEDYLERLTN